MHDYFGVFSSWVRRDEKSPQKLRRARVVAPQVKHPGTWFAVTLRALAGDGHLAQPWPLRAI